MIKRWASQNGFCTLPITADRQACLVLDENGKGGAESPAPGWHLDLGSRRVDPNPECLTASKPLFGKLKSGLLAPVRVPPCTVLWSLQVLILFLLSAEGERARPQVRAVHPPTAATASATSLISSARLLSIWLNFAAAGCRLTCASAG